MKLDVIKNQSDDSSCCDSGLDLSRRRFLVAASAFTAGLSGGPLLAEGRRKNYSDAVTSHDSLRGYWQFDGDLVDLQGKASATGKGSTSFVEGAVEGKALSLVPSQSVSVKQTGHLRSRAATLELFFMLASPPRGNDDPVIIAQTAGQQARYVVGVKNDLSALVYRNVNRDVLTTINLPTDQPIEVGRWYHLAITSFDLDLRAYVDGYECSLVGGAFEFTRKGPAKSTMTFGETTVNGWGCADICLDEVACYASGLTQDELQEHLKAAQWEQRLIETGELVVRALQTVSVGPFAAMNSLKFEGEYPLAKYRPAPADEAYATARRKGGPHSFC